MVGERGVHLWGIAHFSSMDIAELGGKTRNKQTSHLSLFPLHLSLFGLLLSISSGS